MATEINHPAFGFEFAHVPRGDEAIRQQVQQIIGRLYPANLACERRTSSRWPFPFLLRLTPVDQHTRQPVGEPIVVVGKDLSERGVGFFHPQPLLFRRAIVTIEDNARRSVSFLIDLSWCRFTRLGWYDSGGRFLQIVSPLAA